MWASAKRASEVMRETETHGRWITATEWHVAGGSFGVEANIGQLIEKHGSGVYTVAVWAIVDGQRAPVSEYSIFLPAGADRQWAERYSR